MKRKLVVRSLTILLLAIVARLCGLCPRTYFSTGEGAQAAGYEFVRIPAGKGVKAFEIGKYDVTVAQYRKFARATGYRMPWPPSWGWKDDHPIVKVSQADARAFCRWTGGRLPTIAEWEHAARGGLHGKKYVWGDEWPPPKGTGNFVENDGWHDPFVYTSPVGFFKPNGYGLYDMAGNVWQWVDDGNCSTGCCRGGSFCYCHPRNLWWGFSSSGGMPSYSIGFRVARTLK